MRYVCVEEETAALQEVEAGVPAVISEHSSEPCNDFWSCFRIPSMLKQWSLWL